MLVGLQDKSALFASDVSLETLIFGTCACDVNFLSSLLALHYVEVQCQ